MPHKKLTSGVLGLDQRGKLLLETATRLDCFHVVAVADKNTNVAEEAAAQFGCVAYDDYRQFVIQNQLDCLFVAAPVHSCAEHLKAAIKKGFNILKLPPPARDFGEAVELVRLAEEQGVSFGVANVTRFTKHITEFQRFLNQSSCECVFLIDALCKVAEPGSVGWRSDPKLAGGGVLLYECYEMIDWIVTGFGLPQQVYSLNTNTAHDKQQRLYLAEDIGIVTMKHGDCLVCNLTATKGYGPEEKTLTVYCRDKVLTLTETRLVIADKTGAVEQEFRDESDYSARLAKVLANFAANIRSPDENKLVSTASENLKNMAVVESAYLSARTGMPEEPCRILNIT